jgi:hypothetical protein
MRSAFMTPALVGVLVLWAFLPVTLSITAVAKASELKDAELANLVRRADVYSFPVYEMYRTRLQERRGWWGERKGFLLLIPCRGKPEWERPTPIFSF